MSIAFQAGDRVFVRDRTWQLCAVVAAPGTSTRGHGPFAMATMGGAG